MGNPLLQPLKSLLHAKRHGNGATAWDRITSDAETAIEAAEADAKCFTIIGYYDDTGQAFSMPAKADDAYAAMRIISESVEYPDTLCIVGAIAGQHPLITPGCDNGMTAYASDLAEGEAA